MRKELNILSQSIFLILLLVLSACAYRPKLLAEKILPQQIAEMKKTTRLNEGEKIKYGISWLGISCGKMDLEIKSSEEINGRKVYHLFCDAGPNDFFSIFFQSRYILETYLDAETGLPIKSVRKKMPKNQTEEEIMFHWNNKVAEVNYGKAVKKIPLAENSQDLLSFLYYFRINGLAPDKKYNFSIIYSGKSWPVEMISDGVYQLRQTGGRCIRVLSVKLFSPLILEIMGGKELTAYVSADYERIPVIFSVKTKMGQADTTLIEKRQCELPKLEKKIPQ